MSNVSYPEFDELSETLQHAHELLVNLDQDLLFDKQRADVNTLAATLQYTSQRARLSLAPDADSQVQLLFETLLQAGEALQDHDIATAGVSLQERASVLDDVRHALQLDAEPDRPTTPHPNSSSPYGNEAPNDAPQDNSHTASAHRLIETCEGLSEHAVDELDEQDQDDLIKALTAALKLVKPKPAATDNAAKAASEALDGLPAPPMTKYDFVDLLGSVLRFQYPEKRSRALKWVVRGLEDAEDATWEEMLKPFNVVEAATIRDQASKLNTHGATTCSNWVDMETFLCTAQAQLHRFDWPTSVLHKIFAIRSTIAWQGLGSGPNAERTRKRLHRQSYEAQDIDFKDGMDPANKRTLRADPEKKKALKSWTKKRLDELVARKHLLQAFQSLGFMVILDPCWSVAAFANRHTKLAPAVKLFVAGLEKRNDKGRSPHALVQDSTVESMLAIAQVLGGPELAAIIDEFVLDTTPTLSFDPVWSE